MIAEGVCVRGLQGQQLRGRAGLTICEKKPCRKEDEVQSHVEGVCGSVGSIVSCPNDEPRYA